MQKSLEMLLRWTISAACTTVMLAGCNAGRMALVPSNQGQQSVARVRVAALPLRSSRGPLVYIADETGSFVDIFSRKGALVGRITTDINHPIDLFVDAKHNLWVANAGAGDVLKFRRGSTKPSIYHGVSNAWDAATCPDGTLYVTNFSGSIAVFAPGHHSPTGSLTENFGEAMSIACDAAGNLFGTATLLSPPGYVFEFPAGSSKAKTLPIYSANPVDARPDPAGNLLVLDSAGGSLNAVTEYTESGYPTGESMPTSANWSQMAVAPNGKAVFGADIIDLEGSLRAFPSGNQLQTYVDPKFSQLGGIAYDPGL